ncbi:MAG TPA: hypothetical protein VD862_02955 [Candidatus Paceibacterota bacterium]|nr:hypothetical protein [Candidatus Paceibacterota bacterium]
MPSVDLEYFAKRRQDIELPLQLSSPALVWSGKAGIWLIAPNKSRTQNRIYKALDRLAVVTRGTVDAGALVSKAAIYYAYSLASQRSRGDVHARQLAEGVGRFIAERYYALLAQPIKAEAAIVQLQATPEDDYLAHVDYQGETEVHEKVYFLGAVDSASQNRKAEEENVKKLNGELAAAWDPDADVNAIGRIFLSLQTVQRHEGLRDVFADATRREVVLLDRAAYAERRFGDIFRRMDF